jgi:hypothetical protein
VSPERIPRDIRLPAGNTEVLSTAMKPRAPRRRSTARQPALVGECDVSRTEILSRWLSPCGCRAGQRSHPGRPRILTNLAYRSFKSGRRPTAVRRSCAGPDRLRADLTPEEQARVRRIGRIGYKSAGAREAPNVSVAPLTTTRGRRSARLAGQTVTGRAAITFPLPAAPARARAPAARPPATDRASAPARSRR